MGNDDNSIHTGEFEIIARLFAPLAKDYPGAFDLTDDCASFTPEPGNDLVLTKDTIVSGVHFLDDNPATSIARKALGVNLSDLAAKGADPKVYLLSIALPKTKDFEWLKDFATGLQEMQEEYAIHLIGGDTVSTPGPMTISITMLGQVPTGRMVLRSGAQPGDVVFVTGTIGDSYLGLQEFLKTANHESEWLRDRYLHPQPRCKLAEVLRQYATAAMDISDGLAADFAKLCRASEVGGIIKAGKVPLSEAARDVISHDNSLLAKLISGGDDYEVLVTVRPENTNLFETSVKAAGVKVTAIGSVITGSRLSVIGIDGGQLELPKSGFDHFS